MTTTQVLRKEVKKYIDKADNNTLKMIHAMLEVNNEESDWWNDLPVNIKKSIESGLKDVEAGRVLSHEEVMRIYFNL